MAFNQARNRSTARDPILDPETQALIERRGKEIIGLGLITAGVALGLMLASYSPADPGWLAATDGPVHNWLGRIGAALASPLVVITGRGAWLLVAGLLVWGLRLMTHRGEERALARGLFVPLAAALGSVYASTLVPPADWGHSFGLGGLFGDTVLGALLNALPLETGLGLKALSLISGLATAATALFAFGIDRTEARQGLRILIIGLVMIYAGIVSMLVAVLRRSATTALAGTRSLAERRRARALARAEAAEAMPEVPLAAPVDHATPEHEALTQPEPRRAGHLTRSLMAGLRARAARKHAASSAAADEALSAAFPPPPPLGTTMAPASAAQPRVMRAEPAPLPNPSPATPHEATGVRPEPAPAAPRGGGLLARMPMLKRRPPAAEAGYEPQLSRVSAAIRARQQGAPGLATPDLDSLEGEERIRAKVTFALQNRGVRAPEAVRAEPPLRRGPGPDPIILDTSRPTDLAQALAGTAEQVPAPGQAPLTETHAAPFEAAGAAAEVEVAAPAMRAAHAADRAPATEPSAGSGAGAGRPAAAPAGRGVVQHKVRKAPAPSARAKAEAQPSLPLGDTAAPAYELPPLSLLTDPAMVERHHLSDEALEENARMLETVLDDYGIKGEIVSVRPGPVVTMYELEPAPGLKASRVIGLADDIARSMSALSARVSTVPGRSVIGIELPNEKREKVVLREILSTRDFDSSNMRLPLALGKDIGGDAIVANLAKMPHLLIAGTTGSGKSVAINTMILSLLYRLTPDECRLIMIDPKMLELSVYDGIPHLLSPVVTDPKKAVVALKWVVGEMEERYRKMSKMGVRNIEGYNSRVEDTLAKGEMFSRTVQTGFDDETGEPVFETEEFAPEKLPYIVVIVDEMADLMMVAGKEIEACIQRLAQMARASGIHLIMATQRPSVDVITGTIKANFPTRISFQVTSKIDSRTILGEQGAEQLLGMGDMLYMAGGARITRVHGPFVSDEEVEEIVNYLKAFGPPEYVGNVLEGPDDEKADDIDLVLGLGGNTNGENALYDQAVAIVAHDRKCSTSYIQRKLAIGYNKAARLVEQMEEEGVVSAANHVGKREVLVPEPN